MSSDELDKMVSEFGDDCKGTLRRYAVKQLAEEKIKDMSIQSMPERIGITPALPGFMKSSGFPKRRKKTGEWLCGRS